MSPISWWGCPPPHLYTSTEMSASAVPSLCSRDSLRVTRFLVSPSSPIYKYRNVSLRYAQPLLKGLTPCHLFLGGGVLLLTYTQVQKCQSLLCQALLKGLTPCHPFPGWGVLLLTYTQIKKYQPPLCPASARGTHSMSPVSWWGCPPPNLYTNTEISASTVPSLCSRDSLHVTRFLVGVSSSSPIHRYRNVSLRCDQPLLQGLAPCHPFPGGGVLLLSYTKVQKCQPLLCPASAQGTHSMSPVS
jgi:hypothetical protein